MKAPMCYTVYNPLSVIAFLNTNTMKRLTILFSLIGLLAVSQSSFAQKHISDDVYGRDTSEAPGKSIADKSNFSVPNFVNGYLIYSNNELQYGLVRFNGTNVIFKDTITNKTKRYSAQDLKGFVAGTDTFRVFTDTVVVKPNFYTRGYYGNQIFVNVQFNQQLIYGDRLSLYKAIREYPNTNYGGYGYGYNPYRYRGADGTISENAVYLKRKNQWGYSYVPASKRDFINMMSWYLADDPALASDIKSGRLGYNNIDEIVTRYNKAN